jgi:hypothetical protein
MTSPLEQKKIKVSGPVVVTANRVGDGAVVYHGPDGSWTTALDGAAIATDVEGARALMAAALADDLRAVGPYIAPVKLSAAGEPRPGNLRELIRLGGPTIELPVPSGCWAKASQADMVSRADRASRGPASGGSAQAAATLFGQ